MSDTSAAATKGKLCLFGGTGNTGKYFLQSALKAGWEVVAFLRTPSKVEDAEGLTKFKGDMTNPEDIKKAIQGVDAVVVLAGVPRHTKAGSKMDGFMSKSIRDIVAAMEQQGVKRFLFQAGGFTMLKGEPKTGCFAACCIRDCILSRCLGEKVSLKENQVIADFLQTKNSSIDWTVTRPGMLEHKDSKGTVSGSDKPTQDTCSFTDLADWEVTLLENASTIYKAPFPTYSKSTGVGNPAVATTGEAK